MPVNVGFVTLALFAFAYGVCYGATIALRPAVVADHFAGPNLAAVSKSETAYPAQCGARDRPALHEFRARAATRPRGVRILGRPLEQRRDSKLRGCGLLGRCRLFLRSKTASNSIAPDEPLPASTEPYEDAGLYTFVERPSFGDARGLTGEEASSSRCGNWCWRQCSRKPSDGSRPQSLHWRSPPRIFWSSGPCGRDPMIARGRRERAIQAVFRTGGIPGNRVCGRRSSPISCARWRGSGKRTRSRSAAASRLKCAS
jgi:hypothetical protein